MNQTVALVTGANKGIGKETVRQLGRLGHTVLLGARDAGRGQAAVDELTSAGLDVRFLRIDVTDAESVAAAAKTIEEDYGVLDILVNNAGIILGWGLPSETSTSEVADTYATNVFGVVTVTNAMLPLLRRSTAGRIVNVSSELGSLTRQLSPQGLRSPLLAHSTSKTALNGVTAAYALELRDTPIKVNAVNPGYCATDLNNHAGVLPAAEGAAVSVHAATLADDGPTGVFFTDGGVLPW